jgi:TRAP-type uncharacterized transport system fused permease subunit
LTISGFLIPFAAVYQPALMLQGSASDAVAAIGTAVLGVVSLSAGLQAYFMDYASSGERLGLAAAGILLIVPNLVVSGLGAALLIGIGLLQYRRARLKPVID